MEGYPTYEQQLKQQQAVAKAAIRAHPGTRSLKGALASKKGKGMSFAQIREAAAEAARGRNDVR